MEELLIVEDFGYSEEPRLCIVDDDLMTLSFGIARIVSYIQLGREASSLLRFRSRVELNFHGSSFSMWVP